MILDLKSKLKELDLTDKDACWYIVRQELTFWKHCYAVSILEEFKENNRNLNLITFFELRAKEIAEEKGFKDFIKEHRMLRNSYYYGLLKKVSDKNYSDAEPTEVYYEIYERCDGNFENTELYKDIIEKQIEKIFIASQLDGKFNDIRKEFRLFPLFLTLKVLIELGQHTGEYKISRDEFKTFVGTTKEYKDYLQTTFYILELRSRIANGDVDYIERYNKVKTKFSGNRFDQVFKNIPYLNIEPGTIALNEEYLEEIRTKIFQYESGNYDDIKGYLKLLYSTESLLPEEETVIITKSLKFNRLLFGAPGTGKSHLLDEDVKNHFKKENVKRITFHPNITYGQFVGTYKPRPKKENTDIITYEFVPGIFLEQLKNALISDGKEDFLLIIEELNRANVQAVFGDVFQLLDRDDNGNSKYSIAIPEEIQEYFLKHGLEISELKLPSNFYIWATMNTADQGVQPIDTAFTRRFDDYEYISINNGEEVIKDYDVYINGIGTVNWNEFRRKLNHTLLHELNIKEDKLIGTFFIKERQLKDEEDFQNAFKYKLVYYLAENIFKHNKLKLFKKKSFNDIINLYEKDEESIFVFNFSQN